MIHSCRTYKDYSTRKSIGASVGRLPKWWEAFLGEPFEWGKTDCASLCVGYINHELGLPLPLADLSSARKALTYYRLKGGLEEALEIQGWENVLIENMKEGDIFVNPIGHEAFPNYGVCVAPLKVITSNPDMGVHIAHVNDTVGPMYAMR